MPVPHPRALAALALVLALAAAAGGAGEPPASGSAAARRAVFASKHRGVAWVAGGPVVAADLEALAELGADWISQTPFGWMQRPDEPDVRLVTGGRIYWGETDEGLVATHRLARAAGLSTALKPHIWIHGSWPGEVAMASEADWRAWFEAYGGFLRHYAALAEREGIDLLVVGNELKRTSRERERDWRRLIAEVRGIYRGALTYAANWDEVFDVPFWDDLDAIGVNAYFPLAVGAKAAGAPREADLAAAWQPARARLERLSRLKQRPVLLTEVGYRPADDCAACPWEHDGGRFDPACQERAYEALFDALWGEPWLAGVHLWKWFPRPPPPSERSFSPQGLPAEHVLARRFCAAEAAGPRVAPEGR